MDKMKLIPVLGKKCTTQFLYNLDVEKGFLTVKKNADAIKMND
jgi:hypothetical protein